MSLLNIKGNSGSKTAGTASGTSTRPSSDRLAQLCSQYREGRRHLTVAKAPGTTHPLTGKVFHLRGQGYSQRQIAATVQLSQSTVHRILSGPAPDDSDPDGVFAEFEELAKAAQRENTLAAYRHVHQTALVCHQNGYDVPWHSLPYLMLLSTADQDATSKRERDALNAEIVCVYQDMREWRERNV